jgi:hypothetical protein
MHHLIITILTMKKLGEMDILALYTNIFEFLT